MTQNESQVKRRIARVRSLEVNERQAVIMYQDVFRTEVGQNETTLWRVSHRCDKRIDLRLNFGMNAREFSIKRVDAQLVEDGRIGESPF